MSKGKLREAVKALVGTHGMVEVIEAVRFHVGMDEFTAKGTKMHGQYVSAEANLTRAVYHAKIAYGTNEGVNT